MGPLVLKPRSFFSIDRPIWRELITSSCASLWKDILCDDNDDEGSDDDVDDDDGDDDH